MTGVAAGQGPSAASGARLAASGNASQNDPVCLTVFGCAEARFSCKWLPHHAHMKLVLLGYLEAAPGCSPSGHCRLLLYLHADALLLLSCLVVSSGM